MSQFCLVGQLLVQHNCMIIDLCHVLGGQGHPILHFLTPHDAHALLGVTRFLRRVVQRYHWPDWQHLVLHLTIDQLMYWRSVFPAARTMSVSMNGIPVPLPASLFIGLTHVRIAFADLDHVRFDTVVDLRIDRCAVQVHQFQLSPIESLHIHGRSWTFRLLDSIRTIGTLPLREFVHYDYCMGPAELALLAAMPFLETLDIRLSQHVQAHHVTPLQVQTLGLRTQTCLYLPWLGLSITTGVLRHMPLTHLTLWDVCVDIYFVADLHDSTVKTCTLINCHVPDHVKDGLTACMCHIIYKSCE